MALLFEIFDFGVEGGDPQAATDKKDFFSVFRKMEGLTQGAQKIKKPVSLVQLIHEPACESHCLDHKADRPSLRIGIHNGQGDALPFFMDPHDNELSRLIMACDLRMLHNK